LLINCQKTVGDQKDNLRDKLLYSSDYSVLIIPGVRKNEVAVRAMQEPK